MTLVGHGDGGRDEAAHEERDKILVANICCEEVELWSSLSCIVCSGAFNRGAEQIWEGCKRFSNPDHQVPLDYINQMLWPLLDALFTTFSGHLSAKHTIKSNSRHHSVNERFTPRNFSRLQDASASPVRPGRTSVALRSTKLVHHITICCDKVMLAAPLLSGLDKALISSLTRRACSRLRALKNRSPTIG